MLIEGLDSCFRRKSISSKVKILQVIPQEVSSFCFLFLLRVEPVCFQAGVERGDFHF